MSSSEKIKIFLIAGEPSGDLLGANLMRGIKSLTGDKNIQFIGIGGEEMEKEGLHSLFPMSDLSVMGVAEVLPRLPLILRRIRETTDFAIECKPDVVITIDSPDFSFRVQKRLRSHYRLSTSRPLLVHYVAPTVWAWRPGRAQKISAFLDHLLALFPFEPPYFERVGLKCDFVGHPVVASPLREVEAVKFRDDYGLRDDQKLLCMLPGSRLAEVNRLLPIFAQTVKFLRREIPDLAVAVPLVSSVAQFVKDALAERGFDDLIFIQQSGLKNACFMASDAALAASGTVSLELAHARLPHIIGYRVSALTAFIAKRLIKTPYVNLINIILGQSIVPEMLQEECNPKKLSSALLPLLLDSSLRQKQIEAFDKAMLQLRAPDESGDPGRAAARVVLELCQDGFIQ